MTTFKANNQFKKRFVYLIFFTKAEAVVSLSFGLNAFSLCYEMRDIYLFFI